MSKVELIYAITEHLKKENKKMTNLKKASVEQLNGIIKDNDINLNEYIELRKQEMKQDKEKKQIEKTIRIKEEKEKNQLWKQEQEVREQRKQNYIYKLSLMTEDERQNLKKKWIENEQKKDRLYMEKHKEQIEKAKQSIKITTDKMREELGGDITKDGLCINGVNVIISDIYDFNPRTTERLENDYNDYYD